MKREEDRASCSVNLADKYFHGRHAADFSVLGGVGVGGVRYEFFSRLFRERV